jgi:ABC-type transporter lipoprotein component MlaA
LHDFTIGSTGSPNFTGLHRICRQQIVVLRVYTARAARTALVIDERANTLNWEDVLQEQGIDPGAVFRAVYQHHHGNLAIARRHNQSANELHTTAFESCIAHDEGDTPATFLSEGDLAFVAIGK